MTPRSSSDLLDQLRNRTTKNLRAGEQLLTLTDEQLNQRPGEKKWSALEALEHLNRYGDFYLPVFRAAIDRADRGGNTGTFTSGWLGNQFAASMKPGPKSRKVSTFPSMNPFGSQLDRSVVERFISQQRTMLRILEDAREVDLTRNKVVTSISRLLKMRLGDGLRTIIYHNWRHVEQALNAVG